MKVKRVVAALIVIIYTTKLLAIGYSSYPISNVGIRNVVLNDSFWFPKIKLIQDSTISYAFKKCEMEGRMENFLIAGGIKKGKKRGSYPFDDTDLYKIIEGASYSLISVPDKKLEAYVDSIIGIIKEGQEQDGYLSTWYTIDPSSPGGLWFFKPSTKRWEHEDRNHELYNSGHLFEAAASHYLATGKRNFLDIAIKNADLLVANFGEGKLQIPPGHQIIETGLIKLYTITNKSSYLQLAKQFLDWRGDSTTHPLYGDYSQDLTPVTKQTEAVGHAVRAVYMYAGMTDIAAICNDTLYRKAIERIWNNVVGSKIYITGGVGAKHEGEMFGENYELPNLTAYNETCAAIGNVAWNQRMFQLTGNSKYIDVLERILYNGLISGLSTDGKKFFYPNPLASDGKYNFNQGACTRSSWFDCSCCPTNLIRFLPSLPGLIYATKHNALYVNLFMSNQALTKINNQEVGIIQQTSYPSNGEISIIVNPAKELSFAMHIRVPGWAKNKVMPGNLYRYVDSVNSNVKLTINGRDQKIVFKDGYAIINRLWKKGDLIKMYLPLNVRKVVANDAVVEDRNKLAIEYGPIVYCAEEIDNKDISQSKVDVKESFTLNKSTINGIDATLLKSNDSGLIFIPYYLWSNRGIGKMNVWLPYK